MDICSHTILTIPASVRFRIRDSDKFPVLSSRAPLPSAAALRHFPNAPLTLRLFGTFPYNLNFLAWHHLLARSRLQTMALMFYSSRHSTTMM